MAATAAWRPIGHVLVEAGAISQEDLELALIEQRQSGRRLGEILIDTGRITWLQLANAIAEQATDLEVAAGTDTPMPVEDEVVAPPVVEVQVQPEPAPEPAAEPEPELEVVAPPPVVPVNQPPVSVPAPPPVSEPAAPQFIPTDDAVTRLETVEAMLKERQRAFLELVSVTERLRATVAKLQDELDQRNAEIMKLRNRPASAA